MALYFYFSAMDGNLVYSNKATYGSSSYTSLGEQTNMNPSSEADWVINRRSAIVTVSKDESMVGKITGLMSMSYMFINCSSLTSLDLSGFDTSSVRDMSNMFSDCSSLTSIDLSGFDTSSVRDMSNMFNGCNNLSSLDLSGFDTSSVRDMSNMFSDCSSLTSIDLSGFDTSSVTTMAKMFFRCANLTSLDLSGFDTSAVTSMDSMFSGCNNLRLITISGKMSNALSRLPADQYYPAAGGSPVAKASLTAGTWVRDEADLTKVTSIIQQAQMSQAISRRIGGVRRDIHGLSASITALSNRTSLIDTNIGVQSVSIDRTPFTIESSSLWHEVVYLDMNNETNAFINIHGIINLSSPEPVYDPYIGALIVLDVNDSDGHRLDLRCAGIVSAFTDAGVCAYTGTYYSDMNTKTLYCAMSVVDRSAAGKISSLILY